MAVMHNADPLEDLAEVYRSAVREESSARASRGHVSAATLERLRVVRKQLRESLHEHEVQPRAQNTRRLRLLAEVDERLHSIQERAAAAHMAELVLIHEAIARLRECASPTELIDSAPSEVCRSCGFTRALVSRIGRSLWIPEALAIVDGAGPDAEQLQRCIRTTEIRLSHTLLESELVRRHVSVLVPDPSSDPRVYKPLVEVSGSTSYVAAPIMLTERVIGVIHADRFGQEVAASLEDRDNLRLFAEHFGLLYERAVLVQRLERQRIKLRETLAHATAAVDGLFMADIELARNEETPELLPAQRSRERSRMDALLTAREREVLELMTAGLTNHKIAEALVISEGTVKSHVKRILRKLHASNRAEAVARYLRLTAREGR